MSATTELGRPARAARPHHTFHPWWTIAAFGLLIGAAVAAHRHGLPLWALAIGVLGPDLSFLAAIGAPIEEPGQLPRRAVGPYNAVHHPLAPLAVLTASLAAGRVSAAIIAVAWLSHLAWDRGLGYRLREPDGSIRA
jgi:hypothetical protein